MCSVVCGAVNDAHSAHAMNVHPQNAGVSSQAAPLRAPVVGIAATPSGGGYWRTAADGGVLTAGDARFYGSAAGMWHAPIVGIAATPSGHGYWLVDRAGGIFTFGDAPYRGSMGGRRLNQPIVGMASTPDGQGYWLIASDGGIFSFHAPFRGSMGGRHLNEPIVGMSSTDDGNGYWEVASDGGIFSFNAPFRGSMGGRHLNQPVVGMATWPSGVGYTLVAGDGGLFRFPSTVPFYGSAANTCPGAPAVGVAMSPGAIGYWITFANAQTYAFSPSSSPPSCEPSGTSKTDIMAADLWHRINDERSARGLPAMRWDPWLAGYAVGWSGTMAHNGFAHSNIGSLLGPYDFVGENIAMGSRGVTVGGLHNALMHSDGHRANILSPGFTHVGVGIFCAGDGSLWITEDFGRMSAEGAAPSAGGTPPVNPVARGDAGSLSC
jgi:uncharacterized protein YkwD